MPARAGGACEDVEYRAAVPGADVYELRFDKSVAVLFAIVGIVGLSVKIGLMLAF